jgi:hypothetical protein
MPRLKDGLAEGAQPPDLPDGEHPESSPPAESRQQRQNIAGIRSQVASRSGLPGRIRQAADNVAAVPSHEIRVEMVLDRNSRPTRYRIVVCGCALCRHRAPVSARHPRWMEIIPTACSLTSPRAGRRTRGPVAVLVEAPLAWAVPPQRQSVHRSAGPRVRRCVGSALSLMRPSIRARRLPAKANQGVW